MYSNSVAVPIFSVMLVCKCRVSVNSTRGTHRDDPDEILKEINVSSRTPQKLTNHRCEARQSPGTSNHPPLRMDEWNGESGYTTRDDEIIAMDTIPLCITIPFARGLACCLHPIPGRVVDPGSDAGPRSRTSVKHARLTRWQRSPRNLAPRPATPWTCLEAR